MEYEVIHKYVIPVTRPRVDIPIGAKPLYVGEQDGQLFVWCIVYADNTPVEKVFNVFGTGQPLNFNEGVSYYLGTVQMSNGLVWHIFH